MSDRRIHILLAICCSFCLAVPPAGAEGHTLRPPASRVSRTRAVSADMHTGRLPSARRSSVAAAARVLHDKEKEEVGRLLAAGFGIMLQARQPGERRLLELGPGHGDAMVHVVPLFENIMVIERNQERIRALRKKGIKGLSIIAGDFFKKIDTLKGRSFEGIIMAHSLLFVPFEKRDLFLRDNVLPLIGKDGALAIVLNSNEPRAANQVAARAAMMRKHRFIASDTPTNLETTIRNWGYSVVRQPLSIVHERGSRQDMEHLIGAVLPREDRRWDRIGEYVDRYLELPGHEGYRIEIDEEILWVTPRRAAHKASARTAAATAHVLNVLSGCA